MFNNRDIIIIDGRWQTQRRIQLEIHFTLILILIVIVIAIDLFNEDKTAYIYQANTILTQTLGAESKSYLTNHVELANQMATFISVKEMREKIDKGFPTRLIHTVRGVGYVLKEDK